MGDEPVRHKGGHDDQGQRQRRQAQAQLERAGPVFKPHQVAPGWYKDRPADVVSRVDTGRPPINRGRPAGIKRIEQYQVTIGGQIYLYRYSLRLLGHDSRGAGSASRRRGRQGQPGLAFDDNGLARIDPALLEMSQRFIRATGPERLVHHKCARQRLPVLVNV